MRRRAASPRPAVATLLVPAAAVTVAAVVVAFAAAAFAADHKKPPRASTPAPAPAPAADSSRPAPERSTRELLQAGGLSIEEGNYAAARDRFREAADIDPRLTQAHFGMAIAALGLRDRRAADKALRTALELAPNQAEVRYALGVMEFALGDPRAAEPDLRFAADADRRFLEARYAVGLAAANRGDFAAAETAFREALKLDGLDPASHYMLGVVLGRTGQLDEAMGELSRAVERAPAIQEARPDDALRFGARAMPPAAATATLGLPLPAIRPAISWAAKSGGPARGAAPRPGAATPAARPEIPDWFLYYHMALQLEDAGQWGPSVDMMQKALALKDRSEGLAVVADRLIDYSPHWHLAAADHHLGRYRDAFLHLGIAKNEGNASADALAALEVLIQKDRLRPRILLDPLPDRTTDESVTVRGLVLADEPVMRVEVSGREALLRPAGAMEVSDRLPDAEKGGVRDAGQAILFEVSNQRLIEGSNLIAVRPYFRNPARDGDLLEARVVRLPPSPKPEPAAAPVKPATPPKGGAKKPAPKAPAKPPAATPAPPGATPPAPGGGQVAP